MKIPSEIKVAGINYQVSIADHLPSEDAGYKWGECNYQDAEIRIWNELSDQKKDQTFVHELTHAIFHEAGIDDQDEDQINRVGMVLYQVLRDNAFHYPTK
ncbi:MULTISPECIES: ImmA/IrrE family metallo-endopeptidase [Bacillati]|uniref:ImmA/IrrE family metallo-endopeptidase n=1 Tax=Streptomyces milbemycinicus TaxID=476552 RepID=A0ABW8M645_9ACTN